jgi:multidrug resistance efflux pump
VLSDLDSRKASEETLKANVTKANQANEKLQALLVEKQAQIESLEEKHRHNREARALPAIRERTARAGSAKA